MKDLIAKLSEELLETVRQGGNDSILDVLKDIKFMVKEAGIPQNKRELVESRLLQAVGNKISVAVK